MGLCIHVPVNDFFTIKNLPLYHSPPSLTHPTHTPAPHQSTLYHASPPPFSKSSLSILCHARRHLCRQIDSEFYTARDHREHLYRKCVQKNVVTKKNSEKNLEKKLPQKKIS